MVQLFYELFWIWNIWKTFLKNQYTSEYIKLNKVQYLVTFSLVIRQLEGGRHVVVKEEYQNSIIFEVSGHIFL